MISGITVSAFYFSIVTLVKKLKYFLNKKTDIRILKPHSHAGGFSAV